MEQTDKRIALEAERERLVAEKEQYLRGIYIDTPYHSPSVYWGHYVAKISEIDHQLSQIKEEEKR